MGVKMESTIITQNHAADPEIRLLIKLILKPYYRSPAMSTAWELKYFFSLNQLNFRNQFLGTKKDLFQKDKKNISL